MGTRMTLLVQNLRERPGQILTVTPAITWISARRTR